MRTDEYGDPIIRGKAKSNKLCKVHKGAHVFKLSKTREFSFFSMEKKRNFFCEYLCDCGKKHLEIIDVNKKEIPQEIIRHKAFK